jgi:hypothetical protein
MINAHIR